MVLYHNLGHVNGFFVGSGEAHTKIEVKMELVLEKSDYLFSRDLTSRFKSHNELDLRCKVTVLNDNVYILQSV